MIADFKLNRSIIEYPMNRGSPSCYQCGKNSTAQSSSISRNGSKHFVARGFLAAEHPTIPGVSCQNLHYLNKEIAHNTNHVN